MSAMDRILHDKVRELCEKSGMDFIFCTRNTATFSVEGTGRKLAEIRDFISNMEWDEEPEEEN